MIPPRSALLPLARIALFLLAALAIGAEAAASGGCVLQPSPGEAQEVVCVIETADRPLRFVVDFAGSHDDTRLTLDATVDGAAVVCDPRSTTSSRFEDGMIHLDCGFVAKRTAGAGQPVLRVALFVHHAQYVDSRLDAE